MSDTEIETKTETSKKPIYEYEGNTCIITTAYLNAIETENPFEDPTLMSLIGTKYTKVIYDLATFPIDNLPNGVTHLNISHPYFYHPVDNLPPSLIYLRIGGAKLLYEESYFNQPLNFLPSGLKILILDALEDYTHTLDNLPPNLEYLYILNRIYRKYYELNNLPPSLKKVYNLNYYSPDDDEYTLAEVDNLWDLQVS